MRQHLRARGLSVALADRGDDAGVMIGTAGGRIVAAIEQDDERRARDQLLQEAELDAVSAHLGDETVKLA
jgi:adenosine/AMP kinase